MTAWRVLDEKRKLRRPSGELEPAHELGEDFSAALTLDGADLTGSRRERMTLVDCVLRRCDLTAAVWQQLTVRQT